MTNIISLTKVSLAYGVDPLLDNVNLNVSSGERVCLIGRNGAGKSSLLKILDGSISANSGSVWRKPNLRIARLAQELPQSNAESIFEFVAEGLQETGNLLTQYHNLTHHLNNEKALAKLQILQNQIDAVGGWHFEQEIKTILTKLNLNPDAKLQELSGGWQRRAALARALVGEPDLLLLDEPTNHLDIEAIQWLEEFLLNTSLAIVFITHDRALLQRLATRIIELDRGKLTSWPGDYSQFLIHKNELLKAEEKANADFDKKLAQEEVWIRQGIKARRTRNEGRVRALEAMRIERKKRRTQQGTVNFNLNTALASGQLVIDCDNVSQSYHGKAIIKSFSTRIMRGDRIGLIGPNGIGKSTLLNILLGKLVPDSGTVRLGTNLKIAYFDQQRAALDLQKNVAENVTYGSDTVEINGQKRHIISYLSDFLFTPQRAMTPVKALSGGECNRLLLARLFSTSHNLLVMDEPTNDLDIETLELLEELLSNYKGTLLIVSHDRQFLNNVVTSTFVFEGNGKIQEFVGSYEDWLRQRAPTVITKPAMQKTNRKIKTINPQKLSYKEQNELNNLPTTLEQLEKQQAQLQHVVNQEDFYKQTPDQIAETMQRLHELTIEIEQAYSRWEELETKTTKK